MLVVQGLPDNAEDLRDRGYILGRWDALDDRTATYSSILAWRSPMDRGAWWTVVHKVAESDTSEVTERTWYEEKRNIKPVKGSTSVITMMITIASDDTATLEEGLATHSSTLAWRSPMDRGACQAVVHRVAKIQTWLKQLSTHIAIIKYFYLSALDMKTHLIRIACETGILSSQIIEMSHREFKQLGWNRTASKLQN